MSITREIGWKRNDIIQISGWDLWKLSWSRVYENSVLDREDFFARKKKKELKGILKFNFLNFYLKCVENA